MAEQSEPSEQSEIASLRARLEALHAEWYDGDLPKHLPMGVDAAGRGPVADADAEGWQCWCPDPECVWTRFLERAFQTGRHQGIGEATQFDHLTRSLLETGVRARAAEEIGRFVRTPPGVTASGVTQAYLHAAHVIVTGCVHDAWTACPIQEGADKRADFLRRHGVEIPEEPQAGPELVTGSGPDLATFPDPYPATESQEDV